MASITRFASDGLAELRRRMRRVGVRKQVKALDAQRRAALALLGRTAWQAGLDLTAFAELRDEIARLSERAGDLAATARRLEGERAEWQAKRQAEEARFDALLRPAVAGQTEADVALRAARSALKEQDRALREMESKVSRLASELAKPAPAPAPAGPTAPAADSRRAEHDAAVAHLPPAKAARDQAATEAEARATTARQRADEVARVQSERKAALQPIDAELKRVADEFGRAGQETAVVGREQDDRFATLGSALHARRLPDAALVAQMQTVDALDAQRATAHEALDASLQLTQAMPRGTMALFWTVFVLVPVVAMGAAYVVMSRAQSAGALGKAGSSMTVIEHSLHERTLRRSAERSRAGATAAADDTVAALAAEEAQKDQAVPAFLRSPGDVAARERAMSILDADLQLLGSTADRWHMPTLTKIVTRGEPELRQAATEAVGMIGPKAEDVDLLMGALNDPVPAVREAAVRALGQVRDSPATALLVRLAHASVPSQSASRPPHGCSQQAVPDARRLGAPLYPGATFLYYVSDVQNGRAAFAAPDPLQQVIDFYASAGRQALDGQAFSRSYLGGTPSDPSGIRRAGDEMEAWFRDVAQAKREPGEIEAEANRRSAHMQNLPLIRYADAQVFGTTRYIAIEESSANGQKRATRWVAIADAPALKRVLVEIHFPGDGQQ